MRGREHYGSNKSLKEAKKEQNLKFELIIELTTAEAHALMKIQRESNMRGEHTA